MTEPMTSTLDGWQPRTGQLVWETIYSPHPPGLTLRERIATGNVYMPRMLMRVHGITPDYLGRGVTRWYLRDPDAKLGSDPTNCEGWFPSKGHGPSLVESDWAVLEDASDQEQQGALF